MDGFQWQALKKSPGDTTVKISQTFLSLAITGWVICFDSVGHAGDDETTVPVEHIGESPGRSAAVIVGQTALLHTAQLFATSVASFGESRDEAFDRQARSCIAELGRVLGDRNSRLEQLVKLNLYASSDTIAEKLAANLHRFLPNGTRPAVCIVTTKLPRSGVDFGLDAVAWTKSTFDEVHRWKGQNESNLATDQPRAALGTSVAAVLPTGPAAYVSGQAEAGDGSLADASKKTMQSLLKTIQRFEMTSRDVVQVKAFLSPMAQAATAIEQIEAAFPGQIPPPLTLVEWQSSLPIEIELIASSPVRPSSESRSEIEFLTPEWMKPSPLFARVTRNNQRGTIYFSAAYGKSEHPDSTEEVRGLFDNVRAEAEALGADLNHLIKATYYVTSDAASQNLNVVRPDFYAPASPPSASKARVAGTGVAGRTIAIDFIGSVKSKKSQPKRP